MYPHTSALVLHTAPAHFTAIPPRAPRSPCLLLRDGCCLTLCSDPAKSEVIASPSLLGSRCYHQKSISLLSKHTLCHNVPPSLPFYR